VAGVAAGVSGLRDWQRKIDVSIDVSNDYEDRQGCGAADCLNVDALRCKLRIVFIQRATRLKVYFWAAGLVAIVVVVSPLALASKMFLLAGFTCIAAYVTLLAALPVRPLPAD
jgi:hypothetical protein